MEIAAMEDAAFREKRPAPFLGASYATRRHREQSEATQTRGLQPRLSLSCFAVARNDGRNARENGVIRLPTCAEGGDLWSMRTPRLARIRALPAPWVNSSPPTSSRPRRGVFEIARRSFARARGGDSVSG